MNNLMDTVKQRANSQFDTQKGRATESLSAIAGAVRQSTQQLRSNQHEGIAQYVESAAEQLERFSSGLRDKSADELIRDVRDLARRQPALFIGGSFAVGLFAARFFKSSRQAQYQGYGGGDYGSSGWNRADLPPRDFVTDVDTSAGGAMTGGAARGTSSGDGPVGSSSFGSGSISGGSIRGGSTGSRSMPGDSGGQERF